MAVEVCSSRGVGEEHSLLVTALTEHGDACVWRCIHVAEQGTAQSLGASLRGKLLLHVRAKKRGAK